MQLIVQPKKVAVAARNGEFGVTVAFGSCLASFERAMLHCHRDRTYLSHDRVLCVRTRQVADLVRVAHVNGEGWLCGLFHAHAWLSLSLRGGRTRRLDWRRRSWSPRYGSILLVVVQVHRIHHSRQRSRRRSRCLASISGRRFFLRRRRRSFDGWRRRSAQGTEGIFDSFELGGLHAVLPPSRTSSSGRTRCNRDIRDRACSSFGGILRS